MREIGGYFGLEQHAGEEYYPELVALNSGRNALSYLLMAKGISRVLLPYFLCDCIEATCKKHNVSISYYHIDEHLLPILERDLEEDEYLYCVNYFGLIQPMVLKALKNKYKRIIVDNAQAFFELPIDGIDTIFSCRKFFGVSDGAYLQTDVRLNRSLNNDISVNRMKHLLGRIDVTAERYYSDFLNIERSFSKMPLEKMSLLTHSILRGIRYNDVIKKRKSNFSILYDTLKTSNSFIIKHVPRGPYAYPYYCRNGPEVRRKLAERRVYIPTLWPNVINNVKASKLEHDYAENILHLPCDQRYGREEMNIILEEISNVQ